RLALGQRAAALEAYRRAYAIRLELRLELRAIEPLAGMAAVFLADRDLVQAQQHVEQILAFLEQGSLDGADEPFRVYLTCYQVLRASRDQRAQPLLKAAVGRLRERAMNIGDLDQRRAFLVRVPANRALLAAWQAASTNTSES